MRTGDIPRNKDIRDGKLIAQASNKSDHWFANQTSLQTHSVCKSVIGFPIGD